MPIVPDVDPRLHDPEPIEPRSRFGCGSDTCVACNGNYAWRKQNEQQQIDACEEKGLHFINGEDLSCSECGCSLTLEEDDA